MAHDRKRTASKRKEITIVSRVEMPEPLVVRMDEAMKLARVSEHFLRNRMADGTLRTIKRGRSRFIDYQSLKALVAPAHVST